MALIGNNSAAFEKRKILPAGAKEISERAFNGIIGAMLLWGFLLNYAVVHFFGDAARSLLGGSPIAFLIGYIVLVIIGSILIARPSPVLSFIGYNLIAVPIGFVICGAIDGIPTSVVRSAILMTAIVTLSMMIISTLFPSFFLSIGRALLGALGLSLLGYLITHFLLRMYGIDFTWIFAGIFSLYIGYDWARANTCAKTVGNAIDLSAQLYLDIINLFLRILQIMNKKKD